MSGDENTVLRLAALSVALIVWTGGCGGDTATPPSCSFAVSPGTAVQPASGGSGTATVTAPAACSWTTSSDVGWVTVTAGIRGQGEGTVTYRVAPNTAASVRTATIEVVDVNGQSVAVHRISQQGVAGASPVLSVSGAYTFRLEADSCGWPVTTFYWPVTVKVTSNVQGTTAGSVVFPPIQVTTANMWDISVGPTGTQLVPGQGSPGPAAAAYDLVVDGGLWEAGGPTRAHDGRGEITDGTATGARLTLVLLGSEKRWECSSDARWSLLTRWVDKD